MQKTGIGYLTHTWNPIAMRCDQNETGRCEVKRCWHQSMASRLAGNDSFSREEQRAWSGEGPPVLREQELDAPLRRKIPSVIGVQFMGDIAHDSVYDDWVHLIIAVAAIASWHTFVFLTKRPARLRKLLTGEQALEDLDAMHSMAMEEYGHHVFDVHARRRDDGRATAWCFEEDGLPPNCWWGITAENQARADERIPDLLAIHGRHWLSIEPMLGPVDLSEDLQITTDGYYPEEEDSWVSFDLSGGPPSIDGVIAGCESGPKRRPTDIEWLRGTRDQCAAAGTAFMLKQMSVDGKVVAEPFLDGRQHLELPW